MPYLITTTEPQHMEPARVTCAAVATSDDARLAIIAAADKAGVWIGGDALHGPVDRGGTVELPDGTVLEVRPINGYTLAGIVANASGQPCRVFDAVAGFNARA